jgi:hypothetical protein
MYNEHNYDLNNLFDVRNKLLCTFSTYDDMNTTAKSLFNSYSIFHNKIFILSIPENNEYALTYNIDGDNIVDIPDNTVLVHRKKEYNVLYSINSLNLLVRSLNNGINDPNYIIDWDNYKNSLLLTHNFNLKILKTKLYKILEN